MAFDQADPDQPAPLEDWEDMYRLWHRQLQMEFDTVKGAIKNYEKQVEGSMERKDMTSQSPTRLLLLNWYSTLVDAIKEEQQMVGGPLLPSCSDPQYADCRLPVMLGDSQLTPCFANIDPFTFLSSLH